MGSNSAQKTTRHNASWESNLFFPTRVITQVSNDQDMVEGLRTLFRKENRFREDDYTDIADAENLLDLADKYPAMGAVKQFMWQGMQEWLKAEGITGNYTIKTHIFANYGKKGHFVPAHNHIANLSGVYYVDVPSYERNELFLQGDDKAYWHQDQGVLILHDPRFNASLVEPSTKHFVKLFPRTGLGIIFPSYLWHSVTPHMEDKDRISLAINFTIVPEDDIPMPEEKLSL